MSDILSVRVTQVLLNRYLPFIHLHNTQVDALALIFTVDTGCKATLVYTEFNINASLLLVANMQSIIGSINSFITSTKHFE